MQLSQELQHRLRQAIPDYESRSRFFTAARRRALDQLAVRHKAEANALYNQYIKERVEAIESRTVKP